MEENRAKGILIAFAPVLLLVAGGLIMLLGGYRGYTPTWNFLQLTGAAVSAAGAGWVLVIILRMIVHQFKPKK